ncbi:MAG: diguanylate cyclase [Pseudomonadota bacterium]
MPVTVQFLLSSPSRLITAVVLFVVLDLSVLLINLWIAEHVARDAVAINLAGRQRMLSQQITKSLLLAHHAPTPEVREEALAELGKAYGVFSQTLAAFARGGTTPGGDGRPVELNRVGTLNPGRAPLEAAMKLVPPLDEAMQEFLTSGTLTEASRTATVAYMTRHNRQILAKMNELTTALEQDSVRSIGRLRIIQTSAFVLALANFLVIVVGLVRRYHLLEKDGQRWRDMAEHDQLTGLYSRTAFREALSDALHLARTDGGALTVLALDLDGFKPVNDRYGHATGDEFLKQVGQSLLATARHSDVVARLGGDEFALLCPGLEGDEAVRQFCDRLIAHIDDIADPQGEKGRVRASIGVALYPDHGQTLDELLAAADRAMYRSKAAGGGQWGIAELNRPPGG